MKTGEILRRSKCHVMPNIASNCQIIMYADDTVPLYCSESASDLQDTIKNELEDVIAWVKGNRLALNLTYTQYMIFLGGQHMSWQTLV